MPSPRAVLLACLIVTSACKDDAAAPRTAPAPAPAPTPAPAAAPAPTPAPTAAAPAEPALPGTPKELEVARKTAVLDGRFADAVRFCSAEDLGTIGDQGVLSCVLSACRQADADKAATWAKRLKGPLKLEARKVCTASGVPL